MSGEVKKEPTPKQLAAVEKARAVRAAKLAEIPPEERIAKRKAYTTKRLVEKESKNTPKSMDLLKQIVLNDHRDVVQIKQALTKSGMAKMIERHNSAKHRVDNPEIQWHSHYEDVNGDEIHDAIIHQGIKKSDKYADCDAKTVYVNGWTTRQSDDAMKRIYRNKRKTIEDRKAHPYKEFVAEYAEKVGIYPNENTELTKKYNRIAKAGYKTPPKLTPYTFFVKRIFAPIAKKLIAENDTKYDVKIMGKVQAALYRRYIKTAKKMTNEQLVANVTGLFNSVDTNQNIKEDFKEEIIETYNRLISIPYAPLVSDFPAAPNDLLDTLGVPVTE